MDIRHNTSQEQYQQMVEYMEVNGDLSRAEKSLQIRVDQEEKWKTLSSLLNSSGTGPQRDIKKWKMVWSDYKSKIKKKALKRLHSIRGTGGGPSMQKDLTPIEKRVISIIGPTAIGGIKIRESGLMPEGANSVTSDSTLTNNTEIFFADGDDFTINQPSQPNIAIEDHENYTTQYKSSPSSTHGRKSRRPNAFEKACSELSNLEKSRLELDRQRDQRNYELERDRIRVEERRLEIEERKSSVLSELINVVKTTNIILQRNLNK